MKTRTLVLMALGCGMAILLAGAAWLLTLEDSAQKIGEQGPPAGVSTSLVGTTQP